MTIHVEGSDPYAWPYDGRLGGDHVALVLAGWDLGWSTRVLPSPPAADHVAEVASAVAALGGLIVVLVHAGAQPRPVPVGIDEALVVTVSVPAIDGFYASPLDDLLRTRGRTHLLLAGHGIEAAVHSTMRSANDRGYECLLVTDACTSLTDDLTAASAKTVTMSGGIFGAIGITAPVLAALAAPDLVPHLVPSTPQEA